MTNRNKKKRSWLLLETVEMEFITDKRRAMPEARTSGGVQSRQDPEPFEKRGESRGRTRPTNQEVK